ncbi:hypothetical protein WJX74_009141 [Apatococcus lobatus]|uniref:ubiquitinyl hydrolase 1 n=1 Tax=Apatococcus lobatus TaxID=904363 RepID=A0AAW1S6F6_9CHLO
MEDSDTNMVDGSVEESTEPLLEEVEDGDADPMQGVSPPGVTEVHGPEGETAIPSPDPARGFHSWPIHNWSRAPQRLLSPPFEMCGYTWKLLCFPSGNQTGSSHLSLYLDGNEAEQKLQGIRHTTFKLMIKNQLDPSRSALKETQHAFTLKENDWGFNQYIPQRQLTPAEGFVVNDTLIVEVIIRLERFESFNYDSKKETGHVGLKNQGATCYMNSLLQTLYNLNHFRKAVYMMPTDDEVPGKSIPLALQSLFWKLQFGDEPVSTKNLTKSFGWDNYEAFMQHDVQELNRVLVEKLEEKMKGLPVEKVISELFEGHTSNFIDCINVDYKSTRKESFMDLQLDVKGCKDIYGSFDRYTEVEKLEGQNQYKAEGFGLQDARKGVTFEDFPPVLQLQLKRFEYDFQRDLMIKINDRYEFPEELDLDRDDRKYMSSNADPKVRNLYRLHSVLVHSGGVHGGHYYAFIRPTGSAYLKFDDEKVTKEDAKRGLEDQYGGEEENLHPTNNFNTPAFKFAKMSNAYMLVYVRQSEWESIMGDIPHGSIPPTVHERQETEKVEKEQKQREKEEAPLYALVSVSTQQDLAAHTAKKHFDLVDHTECKQLRVKKAMRIVDFKMLLRQEFQVPVQSQRLWLWAKRQNGTYRPSRTFPPHEEETATVGDFVDKSAPLGQARQPLQEMSLYMETPAAAAQELPPRDNSDILLFFKFFDHQKQELRFVGKLNVPKSTPVRELAEACSRWAGLNPQADLEWYEEIKFDPDVMCEGLDAKSSCAHHQLEDGDILIFQASVPKDAEADVNYAHAPAYLKYLRDRMNVNFVRLDQAAKADVQPLQVELLRSSTYEETCRALAAALQLDDWQKLQLTQQTTYGGLQPRRDPLKFKGFDSVGTMLHTFQATCDTLYYETLDVPLPELEKTCKLKIFFNNERTEEVGPRDGYDVRVPLDARISGILSEVAKQLDPAIRERPLRLLELWSAKIFKVFSPDDRLDSISRDTAMSLRVEVIPEDQLQPSAEDLIVHVYHFRMEGRAPMYFGDPFLFRLKADEQLGEVKSRIQQLLGVPDASFATWKFAVGSLDKYQSAPAYLEDDDNLDSWLRHPTSTTNNLPARAEGSFLGLEHPDPNPRRNYHNSLRVTHFERPVKIYN